MIRSAWAGDVRQLSTGELLLEGGEHSSVLALELDAYSSVEPAKKRVEVAAIRLEVPLARAALTTCARSSVVNADAPARLLRLSGP